MVVSLIEMKPGEKGRISDIQGGIGMVQRIQSMGIRAGKKVEKKDAHFWRGPQTVLVDNFEVAVGYGMASKIFIELE